MLTGAADVVIMNSTGIVIRGMSDGGGGAGVVMHGFTSVVNNGGDDGGGNFGHVVHHGNICIMDRSLKQVLNYLQLRSTTSFQREQAPMRERRWEEKWPPTRDVLQVRKQAGCCVHVHSVPK